MPFFFALFRLLNTAQTVSRGEIEPLGLFTRELATKMAGSEIFGAGLTSTFLHDQDLSAKILSLVLIIVMSATQFITSHQLMRQNMSPEALNSPMARQQQIFIYVLPIVFAVTGVNFPVALLIYWTVSNLWTMGQQFFIIRNMPAPNTPAEEKYKARMARKGKTATGIQLKNPNFMAEREAARTQVQARTAGQRTQPKSKKRSKRR
nr:YidC/Oxa1 family membrane protein insertase [Serinicoccus sp. CUA-874]